MPEQFIITNAALYSIVSDWRGDASAEYQSTAQYANSPVSQFIRTTLQRMDVFENGADFTFHELLTYFQPAVSENNGWKQVALWPSLAARNVGPAKRLSCKPGRAFRRMLPPETPDSVIEQLVDAYKKAFDNSGYVVKTGKARADFKHMYAHDQCAMQNPYTTDFRKSLANSCMRYDFENLPAHPCEAYASGDFLAVWVEDSEGDIAARCIVRDDVTPPRNGPIYGTSESAMDALQNHLDGMGAAKASYGDWTGATMLRIESGFGGYVAPYLDIHPQCMTDNGDELEICSGGEIDASEYSGELNGGMTCDDCGERLAEHESRSDDDGNIFCDCCYTDRYSICERCHDETPNDDIQEVITRGYMGRTCSEAWCTHCAVHNAAIPEDDSRYHDTDLLIMLHDGEYVTDEGDFVLCELSGDYYRMDECAPLDSGEYASIEELEAHPDYWLNDDGEWTNEPRPESDDDESDADSVVELNVSIEHVQYCAPLVLAPDLTGPVECHLSASSVDYVGQCGRGVFGPFRPGDARAPYPVNVMAVDFLGRPVLPAFANTPNPGAETLLWLNDDCYMTAIRAQYRGRNW